MDDKNKDDSQYAKLELEQKTLEVAQESRWCTIPQHILIKVFMYLSLVDRTKASMVCQYWNRTYHLPDLWQVFEFEFNQESTSYFKSTPKNLISNVLGQHIQDLQYVSIKVDSSKESAESACKILSRLMKCSLKTLNLMSLAKPSFNLVKKEDFVSAVNVVFVNSNHLSSLAISDTPVDDPSIACLAKENQNSLTFLDMDSCTKISPQGILFVADRCQQLRELSINYSQLSDKLLLSLCSEEHVKLENLRIKISNESQEKSKFHKISKKSWDALSKHSPNLILVMSFYINKDVCFDSFFNFECPVTHLYFGHSVSREVLSRIGDHCPNLCELVVCANGMHLLDKELIKIGKHCINMSSLGLGECEISCSAMVEFTRICGSRLKSLFVREGVLQEDDAYGLESMCNEVSWNLGRPWSCEEAPCWD
ncbi:F-box/LRR-repeat protein 21-like [Anneissia japonica]|uniref:F-box/LRR-repeat protein 21-like n=1 Tax=Anneissia japonica TaxID=1529436 RepID=UPI00142583BC|nr:F-box/LRR-repeat protein 21-like [Anneissia japonica]